MKLGVSGPKFRTDHIATLWESRIPDIDALKQHLPGSVLIAIDVESSNHGECEIGLATLRIGGDPPQFFRNLQYFYDQNQVQATTIQISERGVNSSDSDRYGDTVLVKDADEDARLAVEKVLSRHQGQNLILVGFDMYTELEWISKISERCASLALSITAWVDLEELTLERCECPRINLMATLKAMQIEDSFSGNYLAANGAVRCLLVLSALVSVDSLAFPIKSDTAPSGVTLLYGIPRPREYGSHTRHPFSARITTVNGDTLPIEYKTPYSIAKLFAKYPLEAVGLNCQNYRVRPNGVKFWWLSFPTAEVLESFTLEVHRSTLNGKELSVV
jgi:hypothetical protein